MLLREGCLCSENSIPNREMRKPNLRGVRAGSWERIPTRSRGLRHVQLRRTPHNTRIQFVRTLNCRFTTQKKSLGIWELPSWCPTPFPLNLDAEFLRFSAPHAFHTWGNIRGPPPQHVHTVWSSCAQCLCMCDRFAAKPCLSFRVYFLRNFRSLKPTYYRCLHSP